MTRDESRVGPESIAPALPVGASIGPVNGDGDGSEALAFLRAQLKFAPNAPVNDVSGKPRPSKQLLQEGGEANYEAVASGLFMRDRRDADDENNLGCARALRREWKKAVTALETSAGIAAEMKDQARQRRARANLQTVERARAIPK